MGSTDYNQLPVDRSNDPYAGSKDDSDRINFVRGGAKRQQSESTSRQVEHSGSSSRTRRLTTGY